MSFAEQADPFDLGRFLRAQEADYGRALEELNAGRKRSHWMWFIFPQFAGLGLSETSKFYAIHSREEAVAYLEHPVLGVRLAECARALLELPTNSARDILGSPDDLKLRSSATLFAAVSPAGTEFEQLLEKYFDGQPDPETLKRVKT
jgi:uncharacterized protein (DUF1810 family)